MKHSTVWHIIGMGCLFFAALSSFLGGSQPPRLMLYTIAMVCIAAAAIIAELEKLRSEMRERDTSER